MAKAKAKKKPEKPKGKVVVPTVTRIGSFFLTAEGLKVDGKPTFEQWAQAVAEAKALGACLMWVIGDLLVYGQQQFGEDYAQALEAADYANDTIRVAEWVAKTFPPVRRLTELTFSHHQEVAALPSEAADKILSLAAERGLSTRDVRSMVKALKAKDENAKNHENKPKTSVTRVTDSPATVVPSSNGTASTVAPEATPAPEPEPVPDDPSEAFCVMLNGMCRELDEFARRVGEIKQSPYGRFVHWQSAQSQIKNARETLHAGRPTHECPYCKAAGESQEKCRCCGGLGVCTKSSYKAGDAAVGGSR